MSATESETTATPPTDDDVIRIEADVIVHHTGFAWPWTWLPWAPPAGNGNGGAGSTAYSPAAAPPYWPYPGDGPYRDRGYLYWPWWLSSVLAVLGVLVAATVAAFVLAWAYGELFNDNAKPAAPVAKVMTMPKLLASEHFAVNQHAVCSYVAVANGTAYKLYLNRGAACRRTIQTIVPATMVSGFKGKYVRRASVTFVYDNTKLSPAAVRNIKNLALGRQVLKHLRYVVAREKL